MAEGKADVIDTIFETPERQARLDFTPAYAQIPVSIYTHKSITGIHDLESLRGFLVGVKRGDACINKLEAAGINNDSYTALTQAAITEQVQTDQRSMVGNIVE